ncbi:MAG: hypothetical protein ABJN26_18525 [Stappiaceae bacterium]
MGFHSITTATLTSAFSIFSLGAMACSGSPDWTPQTGFDEAVEVFRAQVTKVELDDYVPTEGSFRKPIFVNVYYSLKETIKGYPKPEGPILTTVLYFGGCGVPIAVGMDYVFFVDRFDEEKPEGFESDASGYISIFSTQLLSPNEEVAKSTMAKVKVLASSQKTPQ